VNELGQCDEHSATRRLEAFQMASYDVAGNIWQAPTAPTSMTSPENSPPGMNGSVGFSCYQSPPRCGRAR